LIIIRNPIPFSNFRSMFKDLETGATTVEPKITLTVSKRSFNRYLVALSLLVLGFLGFVAFSTVVQPKLRENNIRRNLRAKLRIGIADTKPVEEREKEIGAKFDIVVKYQNVKTVNYRWMVKPYLDKGKKVVMVLEFMSYSYRNLEDVARGSYDKYLHKFIDDMKKDGNREISIRPLHEFNGDWYSWGTYRGGENNTDSFKRAFRHVAQLFKKRGANVKMQLDYNCENPKEDPKSFQDWFPGEDVVDMILCNGYNRKGMSQWHKSWESFNELFSGGYARMSQLPGYKPLGVGETSTTGRGDKSQWYRDAIKDVVHKFTRVQELDFFLINKGSGDWDLNSWDQKRTFGDHINKFNWARYGRREDEVINDEQSDELSSEEFGGEMKDSDMNEN